MSAAGRARRHAVSLTAVMRGSYVRCTSIIGFIKIGMETLYMVLIHQSKTISLMLDPNIIFVFGGNQI
jgi:hypothetical protein